MKKTLKSWDQSKTNRTLNKESSKEEDRRIHNRRRILDHFGLFIVVPEIGLSKVFLTDMSETGFAFEVSTRPLWQTNSELACSFYLNQGLFFPVSFKVIHIRDAGEARFVVGCQLNQNGKRTTSLYHHILKILDLLSEGGKRQELRR